MSEDKIIGVVGIMTRVAQKEIENAIKLKQGHAFWDGFNCALEELLLRIAQENKK